MPLQAPLWSEVLSCCVCCNNFSSKTTVPVSIACGHIFCRECLLKLQTTRCPFDQTLITVPLEDLPENSALMKILGLSPVGNKDAVTALKCFDSESDKKSFADAVELLDGLASYLKKTTSERGASVWSPSLSKPLQRKLVALLCTQLAEPEGRCRVQKAARFFGERCLTEFLLVHQSPYHLTSNLWSAVRGRGCQFLGPAMQEEVLKLVLLALSEGASLSRKVLVMYIVQSLEKDFPQSSKTSVGHVVQLLYRASCFNVIKRDGESSLMQLKKEFRTYEALRREHDCQIVQIALEAGLRISPDQWSSLLYGDQSKKSHMQSIIDKLQTPQSFTLAIQEMLICAQRSGHEQISQLREELEFLAAIDPSQETTDVPSWDAVIRSLEAVQRVLAAHVACMERTQIGPTSKGQPERSGYSNRNAAGGERAYFVRGDVPFNFKTTMCRSVKSGGACPRQDCTFAHSVEELQWHRCRNRQNRFESRQESVGDVLASANVGTLSLNASAEASRHNRPYPISQGWAQDPNQGSAPSFKPESYLSRQPFRDFAGRRPQAVAKVFPMVQMQAQQSQRHETPPQRPPGPSFMHSGPAMQHQQQQACYRSPQMGGLEASGLTMPPMPMLFQHMASNVAGQTPVMPHQGQGQFYTYEPGNAQPPQQNFYYYAYGSHPQAPTARVVRSDVLHLEVPLPQMVSNTTPINLAYGPASGAFYPQYAPAPPPAQSFGHMPPQSSYSGFASSHQQHRQPTVAVESRNFPTTAADNRTAAANSFERNVATASIHPQLRYLFDSDSDLSTKGQISTLEKRRDEILQRLNEMEDGRQSTASSAGISEPEPEKILEKISLSVASSVLVDENSDRHLTEPFYAGSMDGIHALAMRSHSTPVSLKSGLSNLARPQPTVDSLDGSHPEMNFSRNPLNATKSVSIYNRGVSSPTEISPPACVGLDPPLIDAVRSGSSANNQVQQSVSDKDPWWPGLSHGRSAPSYSDAVNSTTSAHQPWQAASDSRSNYKAIPSTGEALLDDPHPPDRYANADLGERKNDQAENSRHANNRSLESDNEEEMLKRQIEIISMSLRQLHAED